MNRKFHPLTRLSGAVDQPYANKKGGKAPKAPDYEALARAQAQSQIDINRQTTQANRPDQITPWGSIEWTQGGGAPVTTFDQAGYDAAMQQYQNQLRQQSARNNLMGGGGWGKTGSLQSKTIAPPDYNSFLRTTPNADKWTSTMKLDPELQKILDNEFATKQQGYSELQDYLSNINDPTRVNAAPIAPGQTAQDAIMARLDPTFQTEDERVRTRLYNQGVRPGTEAWDNEMRNFERARNDAYSQAALQGINLDTQARQNAIAEQALPLNAINSFLSGSSVPNPGFGNFSQQANAAGPDLLGAAQAGYQGQLNSYNAQQASGSNMLGGLFGLAGTMMGGPMGGALGAALGGGVSGGTSIPINFGNSGAGLFGF